MTKLFLGIRIVPLFVICFIFSFPSALMAQKQVIALQLKNADSVKLHLNYYQLLPANNIVDTSFTVVKSTILHLKIDRPILAELSLDGLNGYGLYLMPDDTMAMMILKTDTGFSFRYAGRSELINNYYMAKKRTLGFFNASEITNLIDPAVGLLQGFAKIDSLRNAETHFLDKYKRLDEQFRLKENEVIDYSAKSAKLLLGMKRYASYAELVALDEHLNEVLVSPISADNVKELPYLYYLGLYYYKRYADDLKVPLENRYREVWRAMITDGVAGNVRDFYHTYFLSQQLLFVPNTPQLLALQQVWTAVEKDVTDPYHRKMIDSLLVKQAAKLNAAGTLKAGMSMPNLMVTDQSGKTVSLSSFKGKWVYLDFWATWCVPCLHDLQLKKEWHFDKITKDLLMVNVCIRSKHEEWKKVINKDTPVGVQLFADQQQFEKIFQQFHFFSVPYYVLIKPDGTLYENGFAAPEQAYNLLKTIGH